MAYEWSEEPTTSHESNGRSYGKGRGFISHNNPWESNDEEDIKNDQSNDDSLWQSDNNDNDCKVTTKVTKDGEGGAKGVEGRGRGRGRGKGRGRGEGGRVGRGRGTFKNRDGNDNDNNDYGRNKNYEDDADAGNENDQDGSSKNTVVQNNYCAEMPHKPKERYIPPDLPSDEKTLFNNGVEMGINFDKYDFIGVKVTGEDPPQQIENFENIGLRAILVQNIQKSGYTKPTPIQKNALPIIMNGRDLMACAQTGSGKTAAFSIPIIHLLLQRGADLGISSAYCEPQALILAPTRELTIQIWQEIAKFSYNSIIRTAVAYGGTSVIHQGGKLSAGCHILVATPGRLMDFVERGRIKFSSLQFLVLDEADRMLDMGFLPNIERIVDHETMPTIKRQTLMFSATFPDEVQHLAKRFLNNYLFVAVGAVGGACADVEQNFYEVVKGKKKDLLKEILQREHDAGTLQGTLVFVEMKKKADFIAVFLSESNYPTTSIHGDRLQRQREEALADFKSGKMSVLVATAVAARGLDIKNVSHVINYDLPKGIDEYVHRIGRTGRVGNRGRATSFFEPDDDAPLREDLVKILKQAEQPVPECLLTEHMRRTCAPGRSRYGIGDIREYIDGYAETVYMSPTPMRPEVAVEPEDAW
ncbi:ATP-dependent RNA helicase vasa [Bombus affinis]|uniref:ATP-dependent RNA helicase vasa n=1 Tax=Bombus affinis TaxID=309941 RepID=UPI0021B7BB93|nr:ATP-dependent RNA helicase vasa [Bombus affinis]XP_050585453.1 ATP-dependent RNA helicase vasa [Bombus affinis]XP_050585454.1 ATP-dependent RNA helicase vasa [Bombus affinis]XP_050585455.1 ATP-dependent RNA helicase vasa [Bombus affinis]